LCILPCARLPDLPPSITPESRAQLATVPQQRHSHRGQPSTRSPCPAWAQTAIRPEGQRQGQQQRTHGEREGEKRKRRTPQHLPQRPGAYQPRPSRRAADDLPEAAQPEPVPAFHPAAARQPSRAEWERGEGERVRSKPEAQSRPPSRS